MIPRSSHFGLTILATAFAVHADLDVPIPAANITTTYMVGPDTSSQAAIQIKNLTGATYYLGKASSGSLAEGPDSSLTLKYSLAYSSADGAYGTSTGILLPITPMWDVKDLSEMTSITYQVKVATPGLRIALHIGSDAYPADMAAENSDLVSAATAALTTTYMTITVLPEELLAPAWSKAASAWATGWKVDPNDVNFAAYTVGIGEFVKNLNFQPVLDPAWGSGGTGFKSTAAALTVINNSITIKNVQIHGVSKYPHVHGTSCAGRSFVVDDFATTNLYSHQPRTPGSPNYLGGYWYALSDTSTDPVRLTWDTTVGSSQVILPTGAGAWSPTLGVGAILNARLEKNSSNGYRRLAGWATLGTDLFGTDGKSPLDLTSSPYGNAATGVGFDLYAGPDLAAVLAGASIDTNRVARIVFSVGTASTPDSVSYSVSIPLSQVLQPGGNQICVDFEQLTQPSSYTSTHGGGVPLNTAELTELSWKIQIEDQGNPAIHTSGPNAFAVANVKFWGVDSSDVFPNGMTPPPPVDTVKPPVDTIVKPPVDTHVNWHHRHHHFPFPKPRHFPRFHAHYHHGLQVVFPDLRWGGFLDVKRQNGSPVGTFKVNAGSIGKILPVTLKRGTYLVSLRLPGYRETLVVHVD